MYIDSHAHLTHASFQEDIKSVLERAYSSGVESIINICTHPDEVERGVLLSQQFPWVYTVAATTPHDVAKEGERYFEQMASYARQGLLVAIGETGLDYHYYADSKEIQQQFLRRYLRLATECNLPVVIHCREAFADLFQILDEEFSGKTGVLHCFTGTAREAQEVIQRGWYLSFSGIVTFKKSFELQSIAQTMPLEYLLIETDAPYLAPVPHRGERNEPSFLPHTAQFIASLRGVSVEEIAAITRSNARRLFITPG